MSRTKKFDSEEVLQKAVNIFWKQGYNATSMDDLVKHLGINRASLYDTFGGKRQLFEKAIHKYIQDNTKGLTDLLSTQTSVKEGILTLFKILVKQSVSDNDLKGCFVVNTCTELIPFDQEIAKTLALNKINFEELLYQFLKTGQETGEIAPEKDIKAIAVYLVTLFNGLKVAAKVNPTEAEMDAIVNIGLSVLK